MSLIKLSASSENEFGRRLLLGSKHLNGSQMGSLQDLHSASSRAIKTRAEGDLKRAAQNLSLSKTITENLKGKYNSSALSPKDGESVIGKIKDSMGSKIVKSTKTVAPGTVVKAIAKRIKK